MIFNSGSIRLLMILTIISVAFAGFPRKNRTRLEHTYVDYYHSNFCPATVTLNEASLNFLGKGRPSDHLIKISVQGISQGSSPLALFSLTFKFFLNGVLYAISFFGLCMILRRLSIYNKLTAKFNIKMSEELSADNINSNNRKSNYKKILIFKALVVVLLFVSAYYAIKGLSIADEVEDGLQGVICSLASFPNNFTRKNVSTTFDQYSSFNDYQYEAIQLRHLFDEVKRNYTELQQKNKQFNFTVKIQELKTTLPDGELKNYTITLSNVLGLVESLRKDSKFMGASINYLRQLLYWIKGCLVFGQSFINSIYRFEKIPSLGKTIVSQIYQLLLLCMAGAFLAITFISIKKTGNQNQISRFFILLLAFSVMICLAISSIGTFAVSTPGALCTLLAEYPSKAALATKITTIFKFYEESVKSTLLQLIERISAQSDGNMAFTNPQVYEDINKMQKQYKKLSEYNYKDIESKLVSQQPAMEKEIHEFYEYYPSLLKKISEVNLIFETIQASIKQNGNFGRLTLRPLGEYFQYLQYSICDVNLNVWQRNIQNMFYCGVALLAVMGCFLVYLRCKLKAEDIAGNEEEGVEMNVVTDQRIRQN